jgi:hypothetical protein
MRLNLKFFISVMFLLVSTVSLSKITCAQLKIPKTVLPTYWEKCVVMIEKKVQNDNGTATTAPHGTGFLFFDRTLGTFLVTNKHILQGRDLVFIRYNKADSDLGKDNIRYLREPCKLFDSNIKPLWKAHPNPNIDVAAIQVVLPAKADARQLEYSRFKSFDSLQVGEDVYFFGFPLNIFGLEGKGDFPILRAGIVSFKSFELTNIGEQIIDSSMFLIDGFSFGGNSGSPVLTKATFLDPKATLIGIISGHVPLYNKKVIGADTIAFEQNTGLAIAICADRIRETLELFRTKESQQKK